MDFSTEAIEARLLAGTMSDIDMMMMHQRQKDANAHEFVKSSSNGVMEVKTVRTKVPGGWLYISSGSYLGLKNAYGTVHSVFVPDASPDQT